MTEENFLKRLADMQTQIKELVPDSLKENGERRMDELISKTKVTSLLAIRSDYAYNDKIHDELMIIWNKIDNMPAVEAIPITWLKRNALMCYGSSDNPFQSVLNAWELENHETKE